MSAAVVDAIKDKLFSRLDPDASPRIVWHAGEPTVAPVAWYERAYDHLRPVTPPKAVFAIQTNGVALTEAWIDFLRRSDTSVGISIDGPQRFHDARRKTRAGTATWPLIIHNLRRLQSAALFPTVITVLHRGCLSAADDFYRFYRDNNVNHVSFSIDEINGANAASSFDGAEHQTAMTRFLQRILNLAYLEGYRLRIREIERISQLLTEDTALHNEQVEPWDVIAVAANGDVTSFSPDFMELKSADHNDFCFGNILHNDFDDLLENPIFKLTAKEIRAGVELCRQCCRYFELCGGGSPSNKMAENKSLKSGETAFCKLSIKAPADALIEFLRDRGNRTPRTWPNDNSKPGWPLSNSLTNEVS